MRSRPVRQHLWVLVGVLTWITVVITAGSLITLRAEDRDLADLTTVTGPAYELNASILQIMTNAETGLRGYLDDSDATLLAPYDGAEQQVSAAEGQLSRLLASPRITAADRRRYARQQADQDTAIGAWWRYAAEARAEPRSLRIASLPAGKLIFDQVRGANAALAGTLAARVQALRALSRGTLRLITVILLAAAGLAVLAGLAMASGMSRAVAAPIVRLRRVVQWQYEGGTGLQADEASGPAEVRDLAAAFNLLSAHNAELAAEQAEALRLRQVASDIGRAIRVTSGVQEAVDVACAELGEALAARRVVVTAEQTPVVRAGGRWQAPDADGATEGLESHVVPIGLGDRAIGDLRVVTGHGRVLTGAEATLLQQVATFLARAINQAEYEAHRSEYIGRLEDLDRQKTEFLSTVSHELRTPLTSIQGYLELLLEGEVGPLDSNQQHMLGVIERNTTRLRGLIEDILVLNRIEAGGLFPANTQVPVSEILGHTAEELRPLADKKAVELRADPGHDPALVIGDRMQLQRALVNVLSNAIKFTPAHGTVRLTCQVVDAAKEVVVTCADTGIGIPEADQEHLFSRFFRASNATSQAIPGTGLGLAIVQAIVEVHHGRLTLASAEGQGTTITLRFPQA